MTPPPPDLLLKPLDSPDPGKPVAVGPEGLTLGRDPGSGVTIDGDRFPQVSTHHARVFVDRDLLIVEDLGSKNGTLVNHRPVGRRVLRSGDVIQLGRGAGARFLVVSETAGPQTLEVRASEVSLTSSLSATRVTRLKEALGIPPEATNLREVLRARSRRLAAVAVLLVAGGVALAVWGGMHLSRRQSEEIATLRDWNRELERRLEAARLQIATEESRRQDEQARLERERDELAAKLSALEQSDVASAGEIERLRGQLETTSVKLEQYSPVNLGRIEEGRRAKLRRVLDSIAYIEKKIIFREKGTDRYLHEEGAGESRLRPITDRESLYFDGAQSGSGFCVSPQGWIVTNAHVVRVPETKRPLSWGDKTLEMETLLDVIFSGTSRRHPATILKVADEGDDDYAILKIRPFPRMPFTPEFDLSTLSPPPGSAVRLFGFPLGRILIRNEKLYTASVFSGIVSRRISSYIQVQASVYPGNSGGPVVDDEARVIGVVTGVQTTPSGQIASDIGFVLPVGGLAKIWPPEEPAPEPAPAPAP